MEVIISKGQVVSSYEVYLDRRGVLMIRVNGTDWDFSDWAAGDGFPFLKRLQPIFRRLFCVKLEEIAREYGLDPERNFLQLYYHFFKRHFRLNDALPDIVETTQGLLINFEFDSAPDCECCFWKWQGCRPADDKDIFCARFLYGNEGEKK